MTLERHTMALGLAKRHKGTEKELLSLLMEMREANEFLTLGYRNLFDYVVRALEMSEAQACYFSQVARKAKEVPTLKAAVDEGTLTLSQARRIVAVVTSANAPEWIEKAATLDQKTLERHVSEQNPNAVIKERIRPVAMNRSELRVGVSHEIEARLTRARDLLSQKLQRPVTLEETLAHLAESFLEREDPVRKAERAAKKEAEPKQDTATPPTSGRRPLRAHVRHAINRRDRTQCTHRYLDGSRCGERRWIDIHHIVPVSRGGLDTVDNLVTLCRAHHTGAHE